MQKKLHDVICELILIWIAIRIYLWSIHEGFQKRHWKETQFYSFYYLQHYRFPFWITQLYYSCPQVVFWGILSARTSPVKAIENCKTFKLFFLLANRLHDVSLHRSFLAGAIRKLLKVKSFLDYHIIKYN